ncbi:MAG: GNAT family N-acetyltransferase [Candidatus Hodarchaeota archaeon]
MSSSNPEKEEFLEALLTIYRVDPCGVLPNAFWKVKPRIEELNTFLEIENKTITHLQMSSDTDLHLYWHSDRKIPTISSSQLKNLKFVLIHQNYISSFTLDQFKTKELYFRLVHQQEPIPPIKLPAGYRFAQVDIHHEVSLIVDVLTACYPGWQFSKDQIWNWTKHPVHDPDLWLWIMDKHKEPAALGIAEVDETIPEASLEWIQVVPSYRGKQLGKCLVMELLNRVKDRVAFTTVSGKVDNPTNPEKVYRSCGFQGRDEWWVLRR